MEWEAGPAGGGLERVAGGSRVGLSAKELGRELFLDVKDFVQGSKAKSFGFGGNVA